MKFSVDRETLLRPLALVSGVVERRQTLPVLSNILLQVEGDQVKLTGTDMEVQLVAEVTLAEPAEQSGEITVPARKFADIWRSLPDGVNVSINQDGERLVLRAGRSRFTLATLPSGEFPLLDNSETPINHEMPLGDLYRLIERTAFSMAQQDVRYFLNGMLLEINGEHLRSVSTDGHRLAMCTQPGGVPDTAGLQVIVPRKGITELLRLLGEGGDSARLTVGETQISVAVSGYQLTSKLVDGKFPDYGRVIPSGGTRELLGDRESIRAAFARAAILSNEKYRGVRLTIDAETLTVQANNPEQEEAEESVAVEYNGDELEIGFNVSYLQDVLGAVSTANVRMTFIDANSSVLVEGAEDDGTIYVVMPMRL